MEPLNLPLELPLWELGSVKMSQVDMHAILGEPHVVEPDDTRTAGGNEDTWAYVLPSGQRVLIILVVFNSFVRLIADPPELEPVLAALGLASDDPRLYRCAKPFRLD